MLNLIFFKIRPHFIFLIDGSCMMSDCHVQFCEKRSVQKNMAYKSYSPPTLNRFFSIHFVLPFLIAGLTLIHLALLHKVGSNSPIGCVTYINIMFRHRFLKSCKESRWIIIYIIKK